MTTRKNDDFAIADQTHNTTLIVRKIVIFIDCTTRLSQISQNVIFITSMAAAVTKSEPFSKHEVRKDYTSSTKEYQAPFTNTN
jgi:hypothetical protein